MVSSEASTTYGQTYDYTSKEFSGKIYSSGVASYEPLVGGEENSLREPIDYSVARIAAPDDAHFVERPIGESFYPPSTIIYGKVTVRNLDRLDVSSNPITSNIGRTEYEFYTAKEFPIYSDMDGLQSDIYMPDPEGNLFNTSIESSAYLSQGFILKLNNMHGKLKSILTFQEGNNNPISGTRYYYKTSASNQKELDNKITIINEDGLITYNQLIGQHVEVVSDMRSSSSVTFGQTKSANLNASIIPFTVIILPIPFWYNGTSSETRDFYSSTLNKVVTQNGILYKIDNINDYSTSTTENLVWDAKTHDVVLSKTTTNYRDFDYAYSTPAYWVNEGMGAAFKNLGYGFKNVINTSNGQITLTNGLLKDGDEIELIYTDANDGYISILPEKLWIRKVSSSGTTLELINRNGKVCKTSGTNLYNVFATPIAPTNASNYVLKVIRSGYRNLLTESAEVISFSGDPKPGSATAINKNLYVLDAGATEYTEDWSSYCSSNFITCTDQNFTTTNPYILNTKGNWREKRGYSYLSERVEKNVTNVYDISKDGTFDSYKPFYEFSGGSWKTIYDPARSGYNANLPFDKWVLSGEITKVNQYGNVLEAKDALNVFSSSIYGYNQTLKKTTAVNARYREIANHNFEDHLLPGFCVENHWIPYGYNSVTNVTAHTGRYSCLLPQNGGNISFEFPLTPLDCEVPYGANNVFYDAASTSTTSNIYGYNDLNCKSCISNFGPISNWPKVQKYTISVWFKEGQLNPNGNYSSPSVMLSALNATSINLIGKSGIINGWQKFDYELTIPPLYPTNTGINIDFINTSLTVPLYADDIRIHPSNASMASYVYDPKSLRLWSDLDDRNFATFYEYSNEGVLVRVKKETEKGIITIQETRNSFKKN
ncbi:MAG: hypothetical protein Q7W45_10825 [Bacteroidota bacterium]|nr:hypothetical protein [Bacteroidota bacterium]MDP3146052.1 hypothetical protein [Bacteroidota bacterium]